MRLRDVMNETPVAEKLALCEEIGTTIKYLRKLSGGYCLPSISVANALIQRYPQITLQDFLDAHDDYIKAKEAARRRRGG